LRADGHFHFRLARIAGTLNGFIGEFLIFKGSFALVTWGDGRVSVLGLLVTRDFPFDRDRPARFSTGR